MPIFLEKRKGLVVFLIIVFAAVLIFFIMQHKKTFEGLNMLSRADTATDVAYLAGKNFSFTELTSHFQNLAKTKGAEYAFAVLKQATLPPDTDLHLLGHAVGDILYKQKGIDGIQVCTEDFRNACSHSIVTGLLFDKGEAALSLIANACRHAPGGTGAYTMCYHGLGHGILAYADYDLKRAAALCQKTGTAAAGYQEGMQCVGGAIMEMISGGGHNRTLWQKARPHWLKPEDPLYSCKQDFMPSHGRIFCLIYITPYLWEAIGADLGHPSEKDFARSFTFCDTLANDDAAGRDACFGGFGKEFIALANNRDIRTVDQMNEKQMRQIYDWCKLAKSKNGTAACIVSTMNSLYWGGENNRAGAIRFCNAVSDEYGKRSCFLNLIQSVSAYRNDPEYRKAFCKDLPSQYQGECGVRLSR